MRKLAVALASSIGLASVTLYSLPAAASGTIYAQVDFFNNTP
jgi:hypothetical protein